MDELVYWLWLASLRGVRPRTKLLLAERFGGAREAFFARRCDYIVDAIDLVSWKLDLIEQALARGIPVISALGTGNKLDPSLLRVSDLSQTQGCPLARVVRKELRKRDILHHKVVWSPEMARTPALPAGETPPPGRRSIPGSVMWVPAAAGLLLAAEVVRDLTAEGRADV